MGQETASVDQLYLIAEGLAQDFSLFPQKESASFLDGVLTERRIEQTLEKIRQMDVDSYIEAVVQPVEASARPGARSIVRALNVPILREIIDGPMYAAELEMDFGGELRRVGLLAQDRAVNNGVWGPTHHELAAKVAIEFAIESLPIVSMIDTPGADGGEEANAGNQAHSISRLIAELCNVDVPTVGIVVGQGYSGGAIPLAAANLLLSLRTGVFNTIQPRGLASLTRRFNLSWQECTQFVGVSSYELYKQGNIDGIVDYDPGEIDTIDNLRNAIVSGILFIEQSTREFVASQPEILEHYHRNINRYLHPTERQMAVHASSTLKLRTSPTQYPNVFGTAFRYLRYLGLRKRIRTTTAGQYGRLSTTESPAGQLSERVRRERRSAFLNWLQDPDKILYEDELNKAWKNFQEKRAAVDEDRGRIATLIFGEPKKNYDDARQDMCLLAGLHLYNRWKAGARDNLTALIDYLEDHENSAFLLTTSDLRNPKALLESMRENTSPFCDEIKRRLTHEGRKLLDPEYSAQKSDVFVAHGLASELNLIIESDSLIDAFNEDGPSMSAFSRELVLAGSDVSEIQLNRRLLEDAFGTHVERRSAGLGHVGDRDHTILDVVLHAELRDEFVAECRRLILFSTVYENLLAELVSVAREANDSRTLPEEFVTQLLKKSIFEAKALPALEGMEAEDLQESFGEWIESLAKHSQGSTFLKSVEEWIRAVHPDKSDTLFVVISFFFDKLLPAYYLAAREGKRFEGKINPMRIGRRKDFWNRLTIAYRDLLFQEVLTREKRSGRTNHGAFIGHFLDNFEERNASIMTADPVSFPALRQAIEKALQNDITPCGLITGVGDFKTEEGNYRVGLVVSNVDFQVGCIDNGSCEKFCKLLVECATERLPVVCFISSGGMQTKEGACSLFSMPVLNDRITRFIRDNDLPIIMFGFGDCTGGAQASFVTHPLVQTYYFTGTKMPFAGQAVVESNLPFNCQLSNYLSTTPGSMRGLVKHPFADDLDRELRRVDPQIPLPHETVEQVVTRIMTGSLHPAAPVQREEGVAEASLVRPVQKTLIHARGCTAVKLVSKAQEHGREVVLIQSDPDMESVPAEMVEGSPNGRVVCIGGNTSDESYLNALSVLAIAESEQVDSLHPGIGFLSEDPNFARLIRQHGINFIGPPVTSMETMGNKSNAINTTIGIGVPVVPGSHGVVASAERAAEIADMVGYPVLLKAVHGGGGKGIQVVNSAEQIMGLFRQVSTEARNAFGNGDLYIEKFVTSLRHIEAQVLRDTHGETCVLGLRDCSVQRNNQKLMEESGSTMLPAGLRDAVFAHARKIADAVDYVGAGTVEFIYDVPNEAIYFMEMNTRLQVEHPVTEAVTGVDIVEQQFEIAGGASIAGLGGDEDGYALEVRINAEKAVLDADGKVSFVPTPGTITRCELPTRDDIQMISMAGEGKVVSPFYDSLIIQVICKGADRMDTIDRMSNYLEAVSIEGISTNVALIQRILQDKVFRDGIYDTDFLPQFLNRIDAADLIREIEQASGSSSQALDLEALIIEGTSEIKVLSPSTGVFYLTPSPADPEYVNVGDVIGTDDTICQMEAMKMFAPVTLSTFSGTNGEIYAADQRYEVMRINQVTGQQVNEGDLLFVIRPAA